MTDIVEQAARVADGLLYGPEALVRPKGRDIAQALADAGLLREPVTTILEEFVVPCPKCNPDDGRCIPCRGEADAYYRAAINAISTYSAAKELARDGNSDAGGYVGRDLRELAERIKQHLLEHPEPPARTVPTRDVYELATERITAESTWTVDAREVLGMTRTVPTREQIEAAVAEQFVKGTAMHQMIDAIHALLAGQPTVEEVKAQALEEAANSDDLAHWLANRRNGPAAAVVWLRERAQQIRDGK